VFDFSFLKLLLNLNTCFGEQPTYLNDDRSGILPQDNIHTQQLVAAAAGFTAHMVAEVPLKG